MTMVENSYSDFFKAGLYQPFLRAERKHHGRYRTAGILARQDRHTLSDPATSDVVMGLTLSGTTAARWKVGSKWREIESRQAGHIGVSPTDEKIDFDVESPHELLIIAIDKSAVLDIQNIYSEDCLDVLNAKGHLKYHRDTAVQSNIQDLWKALGQYDSMSGLLVDALTQSLIARLVRMVGNCTPGLPNKVSPLPIEQLEAFIRENMRNGVSVGAIATLCNLPVSTFNRHFKKETGYSPYQFVQKIRLDMAITQLLSGKAPLIDIALQLGFADQSHFTRFFRSMTGITPKAYQTH